MESINGESWTLDTCKEQIAEGTTAIKDTRKALKEAIAAARAAGLSVPDAPADLMTDKA